jgi:hypothetical protein
VLAESYFSLRLRRGAVSGVGQAWLGWGIAWWELTHCMSLTGLTEVDEMVFFTPS